jgi:D-glycero-D-manno-heptose 1,7-bisphosphate phosphatase
MQEDLAQIGAHIDAFEYCPHHPEGAEERYRRDCRRRKPAPGMIDDLLSTWPVVAGRSFLIGDKDSDLQAAQRANIRAFRYSGGDLEIELLKHIETTSLR